jgi:hypothetical protein
MFRVGMKVRCIHNYPKGEKDSPFHQLDINSIYTITSFNAYSVMQVKDSKGNITGWADYSHYFAPCEETNLDREIEALCRIGYREGGTRCLL